VSDEKSKLQREVSNMIDECMTLQALLSPLLPSARREAVDRRIKQALKDLQHIAERIAALEDEKALEP